MRVEPDHVECGGGEGVLEADFRQAAVAGAADAGDVEGLVDGALDAGAQGVLVLPGVGPKCWSLTRPRWSHFSHSDLAPETPERSQN